jgi:GT2 family glycosyltransferase
MITIVTSAGAAALAQRAAIRAAFARNLRNRHVERIVVVTEASSGEMGWLLRKGEEGQRISLVHVPERPDFNTLVRLCNEQLAAGAHTVALMNADISIALDEDAERMLGTLEAMEARRNPVVFALSRHELKDGEPRIELYESSGLPNNLSADAWVFQQPLSLSRDLFYRLGQMNCDMMFASDLVAGGYRLYNPCLDIRLLHHEAAKDEEYYRGRNAEQDAQEALWHHARINDIREWNYHGVPWVRSDSLKQGYLPEESSTNGRRVIVALPRHYPLDAFEASLPVLDRLVSVHGFEIEVVHEHDPDTLLGRFASVLAGRPRIRFSASQLGIGETRRALLAGRQYAFDRFAFVSDLARIDEALVAAADGIFVSLTTRPVPQPPVFGCTLITSVFRSDRFLRGFLRNIRGLDGYGRLIEHVFVVSELSDLEVQALDELLAEESNVLVLWHREDPGLYECWNRGIRLARTEYVSNANVDDLRHPRQVVTLLRCLEAHPDVALAATALVPFHEYPEDGSLPAVSEVWYRDAAGRFGFADIARPRADGGLDPHNMPHCMPVWRRSLHANHGWFEEDRFGTYADWAFWLKVFERGESAWMVADALSFYFVNPGSHNRRGTKLEEWHKAIEAEFIDAFRARAALHRPARPQILRAERKLHLRGEDLSYGEHRNAFGNVIRALRPLDRGPDGIRFVPFLERQFVWGSSAEEGEAASASPRPLTDPWIGILHVPFGAPEWFDPAVMPERMLATPLFRESLPACRGLVTLCADLQRELAHYLPGVPTLALRHPTGLDVRQWDMKAYAASPMVVQVGDWLRRLQAIHRMRAPGHRRVMLLKRHTRTWLDREIEVHGDFRDSRVEMRSLVPDGEYDELLARSVVLCLMYATAANNVVVECIARATPILINPLPAVIEYLGTGYPLYVRDEEEADAALADRERIAAAHEYLLRRRVEIDLSYEAFCRDFSSSGFYQSLPVEHPAMV